MSKAILFSTRFLEQKNKLFCNDNYNLLDCQSPEYIKFCLSSNLPLVLIQYFNNLYCKEFFGKYKDEKDNPTVLNDNNYVELGEKLWGRIPGEFDKDDWDGFFSDLGKMPKLYEIDIENLDINDRIIDGNEEHLHEYIKKIENAPFNNGEALNTDFGSAIDKKSIDRRFKIYKLKQGELNDIQAFGVWCLKEPVGEIEWYTALYNEIKTQMVDNFESVKEILFFLHDGDIGEQKPFAVKHYKERKDKFNFLDDGKSLSVAIFQHSLSSIATVLSNPKIDDAIKAVIEEMEKGGKRAFLNNLSDYVAYWHDGGKEKYLEDVEKGQTKYGYSKEELKGDGESVEDIFYAIKELIDKLYQ